MGWDLDLALTRIYEGIKRCWVVDVVDVNHPHKRERLHLTSYRYTHSSGHGL